MLTSAYTLLVVIAFALCLAHGVSGKVPLWINVLLICVALLISSVR